MSRKASKRVSFSPDVNDKPTASLKHNRGTKVGRYRKSFTSIYSFRLPKCSVSSPVNFLRRLGANMARALCFSSMRRRSSPKVSSSNSGRSRRPFVAEPDSHHKEAIDDCIEFINSSSSFQRSTSVSADS
ncbi:hypothetical protein HHK36_018534 [Tetracentron sinense]|uniref:Josephin-like protein n=1 Tax=Tetracentron sinense TaxID=13715 RepID=A0A834YW09_TETSI|nr:hypothetical protein HHK36_018534 [Tetracentron sinense]